VKCIKRLAETVKKKDDPKMLIYAAQKAHQAANYILGIKAEGEE
jgi:hypothetical protein